MGSVTILGRAVGRSRQFLSSPGLLAWSVCIVASLFFFYQNIQLTIFNAIDPELVETFHLTAAQLGTFSTYYLVANLLFLIPAGLLLDRFSTRLSIIVTMSLCVFGTAMLGSAETLGEAEFFRFLTGIGSAFCFLICMRLASRWFPPHKLAFVSGLIVAVAYAGSILAQSFTLLTENVGWRHTLYTDAVIGAVMLVLVVLFVKDHPADYAEKHKEHKEKLNALGFFASMKLSYMNKQNWLAGVYASMLTLPIFILGTVWGEPFLTQAHDLSRNEASLVITMLFVGAVVGSPLIGKISDRMQLRRKPMIGGGILSFIVMMLIMLPAFDSLLTLSILFFLLGVLTSAQALAYPYVTECNSKAVSSTSLSIVSLTMIAGGTFVQPIFGYLLDTFWDGETINHIRIYSPADYHIALLIIPVGFLVALLCASLLKETHCKPKE